MKNHIQIVFALFLLILLSACTNDPVQNGDVSLTYQGKCKVESTEVKGIAAARYDMVGGYIKQFDLNDDNSVLQMHKWLNDFTIQKVLDSGNRYAILSYGKKIDSIENRYEKARKGKSATTLNDTVEFEEDPKHFYIIETEISFEDGYENETFYVYTSDTKISEWAYF